MEQFDGESDYDAYGTDHDGFVFDDDQYSSNVQDPSGSHQHRSSSSRHSQVDPRSDRRGRAESFAAGYISKVKHQSRGATLFQHFSQQVTNEWPATQRHSKQEALTLARFIDAVLDGDFEEALDVATRRLASVHLGTSTGNWHAASQIESGGGPSFFVPDLANILRTTQLSEQLGKATGTTRTGTDGPTSNTSKGRGNYKSDRRRFRSRDGTRDRRPNKDGAGSSGGSNKKPASDGSGSRKK